ncbi:MAG TPA: bifunctional UDP-N-acetylglucosamine diphosphorylase/glucosamine-1-phosphate N-acetyltransferase GlmU [Thermoanaerobaculia bacterium]|nr:bifunctional UDP-N-acetylglucosamine diphosphorylase/glucosamine-1-phosphate N-acetyltransferase GlmU [Thermoanaerobaculia bacterium]
MNDQSQSIETVILAAGLGTRMKSETIKILHAAAGRAIVDYVLDLAESLTDRKPILVIGHQRESVREHCGERARYVVQEDQLGTGHAVLQAASELGSAVQGSTVLVLSGDVPLTRRETLEGLITEHRRSGNAATLLTMILNEPALYGRIVRGSNGELLRIVEAKDASDEELLINEVNGGIYVFEARDLFETLSTLSTNNAQGEYYLTDVIARLKSNGKSAGAMVAEDPVETLGVNSRAELSTVEAELVRRHVDELMRDGVTFRNPSAVSIDSSVRIGADTIVHPFVTLEGTTTIGRHCIIEPGVHLKNVEVGDHVTLRTSTVAEDATIADHASVGPFAHLRPGTVLGQFVKVGNFVETKKATFGDGAKASHLSYIGDAEVGADANIGAGTITCNYDGVNKHKTTIGAGAFIGSDSQLVAPVTIGAGAYVGAGSTVTKDVPPDALALSRTPQKTIAGWATKRREEMKKKPE